MNIPEAPREHSGRDKVLAASFGLLSASEKVRVTPPLRMARVDYTVPHGSPTSLLRQIGCSFGALATSLLPKHFQAIATEDSGPDSGPATADRMREPQLRAFYMANPEVLLVSEPAECTLYDERSIAMTRDTSLELWKALERIKSEHPELKRILDQFQIDQAEYDQAMLSMLSTQLEPQNTYGTAREPFYHA